MVEEGMYKIAVGSSSEQLSENVLVYIPGQKTGVRDISQRIPADHYDDYENVYLTEGQFGFSAVRATNDEKMGLLEYRDCVLSYEGTTPNILVLHMMSEADGQTEVYINNQKAGEYTGESELYRDIRIPLDAKKLDLTKLFTLEIRMNHKVKLCYWWME